MKHAPYVLPLVGIAVLLVTIVLVPTPRNSDSPAQHTSSVLECSPDGSSPSNTLPPSSAARSPHEGAHNALPHLPTSPSTVGTSTPEVTAEHFMIDDIKIANDVAKHGWHEISVNDAPKPFSYTCGLMTTQHHPELIIFGRTPEFRHLLLSAMYTAINMGSRYEQDARYEWSQKGDAVAVRPVHQSQSQMYMGFAMGHMRITGKPGQLKARQVFWPDTAGRFPYESGCSSDAILAQPILRSPATQSEIDAFRRLIGDPNWSPVE